MTETLPGAFSNSFSVLVAVTTISSRDAVSSAKERLMAKGKRLRAINRLKAVGLRQKAIKKDRTFFIFSSLEKF
jgi:hypothetical protein